MAPAVSTVNLTPAGRKWLEMDKTLLSRCLFCHKVLDIIRPKQQLPIACRRRNNNKN